MRRQAVCNCSVYPINGTSFSLNTHTLQIQVFNILSNAATEILCKEVCYHRKTIALNVYKVIPYVKAGVIPISSRCIPFFVKQFFRDS